MKVCWNILICMWIGVIHGAVHVNGTFSLTSSPLTPTDGDLFTLTCSFCDNSVANVGWQQNNKLKVATQKTNNCSVQALNGDDIISRINVSCNGTIHSIAFKFNSSTDKGSAWQCGKLVNDTKIYPRSDNYTIGTFSLTSSPLTPTDGDLFTLTCSFCDNSVANVGWQQNNKLKVATQKTNNCSVQALNGDDIISRINVSCNGTIHSIAFKFNSSTDKGSAWQCGKLVNDTKIYPRSDNYTIGNQTSSPVMSTQSLSTTVRYMETTSDPETVTLKKGTMSYVCSKKLFNKSVFVMKRLAQKIN
ncbi:uncharacterized protein [Haliotis cracherodii]|uniref:uncharacterized protein n=1 Tax=Haliotis cracherodii TaxID=6455 RepID=UPI0039EB8A97